jgi:hypothetical protein
MFEPSMFSAMVPITRTSSSISKTDVPFGVMRTSCKGPYNIVANIFFVKVKYEVGGVTTSGLKFIFVFYQHRP